MKKFPRGVYYLGLFQILKSVFSFRFSKFDSSDSVNSFEEKARSYTGAKYLKAMPHARVCLYYITKTLGLEKGDEILMSPVTLPDMVNMILLAGLKPVFVDFDSKTYSMSLEEASSKINKKSKVLYLTHLYGIIPDMLAIEKYCRLHNLIFIQDCTQSYGCKFDDRPLLSFAHASFFSTCSLKDLHTHMGALLCTQSETQFKQINLLTKNDFSRLDKNYFWKFLKEDLVASVALNQQIFTYFVYYIFFILFKIDPKIIEDLIDARGIKIGPIRLFKGLFGGSGYKRRTEIPKKMLYHFNDFQAKIGIIGLSKILTFQEKRIKNSHLLIENLSPLAKSKLPILLPNSSNSFWRIPLQVDNPNDFEKYLFNKGIDPGKTTLPCLSTLSIFQEYATETPNALKISHESIFLPNFHYLKHDEIIYVAKTVNEYFDV